MTQEKHPARSALGLEEALRRDVEAMRRVAGSETHRSLPEVMSRARRDRAAGPSRGSRTRPWLVTASAAAALALFLVPVSYDQTIGHEVSFQLGGNELHRYHPDQILEAMRVVVGDDRIRLESNCARPESCELMAFIPARSGVDPKDVLERCAQTLVERGLGADTGIAPRVRRVSGNVLRMTRERVVHAPHEEDPAQLEARIRSHLKGLGLTDAQIVASKGADGLTRVLVIAEAGEALEGEGLEREAIFIKRLRRPADQEADQLGDRPVGDPSGQSSGEPLGQPVDEPVGGP